MEEQKNNKRVLSIELDNEVKKVSITGKDSDEKVVMRQELSEDDLDVVAGGECRSYYVTPVVTKPLSPSCKRHE
ncbi:MAG: hypothetical protein IJR07_10720 [Bacteroidaceae bacterium]|nr:hypothetical protein [Bacteroidaceae bacterium]